MDYYEKYLKYKNKYISLKNSTGGYCFTDKCKKQKLIDYGFDEKHANIYVKHLSNDSHKYMMALVRGSELDKSKITRTEISRNNINIICNNILDFNKIDKISRSARNKRIKDCNDMIKDLYNLDDNKRNNMNDIVSNITNIYNIFSIYEAVLKLEGNKDSGQIKNFIYLIKNNSEKFINHFNEFKLIDIALKLNGDETSGQIKNFIDVFGTYYPILSNLSNYTLKEKNQYDDIFTESVPQLSDEQINNMIYLLRVPITPYYAYQGVIKLTGNQNSGKIKNMLDLFEKMNYDSLYRERDLLVAAIVLDGDVTNGQIKNMIDLFTAGFIQVIRYNNITSEQQQQINTNKQYQKYNIIDTYYQGPKFKQYQSSYIGALILSGDINQGQIKNAIDLKKRQKTTYSDIDVLIAAYNTV